MDIDFFKKKKVRKISVLTGIGMAVIIFIIMLATTDDFWLISLLPILGFVCGFVLIQLECVLLKKIIKASMGNITVQSAEIFKDNFGELSFYSSARLKKDFIGGYLFLGDGVLQFFPNIVNTNKTSSYVMQQSEIMIPVSLIKKVKAKSSKIIVTTNDNTCTFNVKDGKLWKKKIKEELK